MKVLLPCAWLTLSLATFDVTAQDLTRCAGIAAPDVRLACYDKLAHRAPDANPAPTAAPTALTSASPSQPDLSPQPAVEDPKKFGLNPAQQHVENIQVKSEEAQITSIARGESGSATIVLDNGQSWRVSDDDGWLSNGYQVTIKRAALGSFLMRTPSHHTYRVHRIS